MKLIPKNWNTFQHYRDRCPPWIKLHREILNDKQFMCLPLASKAIAPLLWLLASESKDGQFDASTDELSFRLRITNKEVEEGLKPLINNGFFIDASTMLAPCLQLATTERETEREGEKEKETKQSRGTRLPTNWVISVENIEFCNKTRPDLSPMQTASRFKDYWTAQPGSKGVKLDWDATWRNWVRAERSKDTVSKPQALVGWK